ELHDARIERGGDRSEAGRSELRRRRAKIRGVEEVERLGAQLDGAIAAAPDAAHEGEIDVTVRRSAYRIARRGPDRKLIGRRERGGIEPGNMAALIIRQRGIANAIRPLRGVPSVDEPIGLRDRAVA